MAFTAGLTVSQGVEWPGGGDTLRVVLDTRSLPKFKSTHGWCDTTLLEATIECMKANAAQLSSDGPRGLRFLEIRVTAGNDYAKYGGTFELSDYRCGSMRRQSP